MQSHDHIRRAAVADVLLADDTKNEDDTQLVDDTKSEGDTQLADDTKLTNQNMHERKNVARPCSSDIHR